jgi:hypothetical protein
MVVGWPSARSRQSVSFINSNQALASPPIVAAQQTGTKTKAAQWTPHNISTPAIATPPAVSVDGFTSWRVRATGRGESICSARRSRAINAMATNTANARSSMPRTHSACTGIDRSSHISRSAAKITSVWAALPRRSADSAIRPAWIDIATNSRPTSAPAEPPTRVAKVSHSCTMQSYTGPTIVTTDPLADAIAWRPT